MRMMKRILLLSAVLVVSHLTSCFARGEDCEESSLKDFPFTRTFVAIYEGVGTTPQTRETAAKAMEGCDSLEVHAERMATFFSSYGIDVSRIRENPYENHDERDYSISMINQLPPDTDVVVSGTIFDHAMYMEEPVYQSGWLIVLKRDIQGPKGLVPKDHSLFYANLRFNVHGQTFCVESKIETPVVSSGDAFPLETTLHNPYWGEGITMGMYTRHIINNMTAYKGHYSMTFPPGNK